MIATATIVFSLAVLVALLIFLGITCLRQADDYLLLKEMHQAECQRNAHASKIIGEDHQFRTELTAVLQKFKERQSTYCPPSSQENKNG